MPSEIDPNGQVLISPDVATCAECLNELFNQADRRYRYGICPPAIAEWIVNLGEAAEYMFDHNIFQDNLVGVDFCEQMVKETNPDVLAVAEKTLAPHGNIHG